MPAPSTNHPLFQMLALPTRSLTPTMSGTALNAPSAAPTPTQRPADSRRGGRCAIPPSSQRSTPACRELVRCAGGPLCVLLSTAYMAAPTGHPPPNPRADPRLGTSARLRASPSPLPSSAARRPCRPRRCASVGGRSAAPPFARVSSESDTRRRRGPEPGPQRATAGAQNTQQGRQSPVSEAQPALLRQKSEASRHSRHYRRSMLVRYAASGGPGEGLGSIAGHIRRSLADAYASRPLNQSAASSSTS